MAHTTCDAKTFKGLFSVHFNCSSSSSSSLKKSIGDMFHCSALKLCNACRRSTIAQLTSLCHIQRKIPAFHFLSRWPYTLHRLVPRGPPRSSVRWRGCGCCRRQSRGVASYLAGERREENGIVKTRVFCGVFMWNTMTLHVASIMNGKSLAMITRRQRQFWWSGCFEKNVTHTQF